MPMTRNRSQLPTSTKQTTHVPEVDFDATLTVTRSGKVIHHLTDQHVETPSRSAKRRRIETLSAEETAGQREEALDARVNEEATAPSVPETNDAVSGDLQARIANNAGTGVHGHGARLLTTPAQTGNPLSLHFEQVKKEQTITTCEADSMNFAGSGGPVLSKPGSKSRIKVESLPILDSVATQVLSNFAKSTYQETVTFTSEYRSEAGQEYAAIKNLFDITKAIYKSKTPFLSASELDINDATQIEVLRKANLATFVSTIFEPEQIGFSDLDAHFLEIFVPNNGRLLKAQAQILLELKTQAFIAAARSKESAKEDMLYALFPDKLESRILARRPGARGLAPSEQDFVKRALSRRDFLLAEIKDDNLNALPERYRWEDFLREISSYISRNFEAINSTTNAEKAKGGRLSTGGDQQTLQQGQLESNFAVMPVPISGPPPPPPLPQIEKTIDLPKEDFVARAARAAKIALQGHNSPEPHTAAPPPASQIYMHLHRSSEPTFQQVQILPTFQQYIPPTQSPANSSRSNNSPNYGPLPEVPHVSQSAPTQELYARARMAASAKASPTSRRTGLPSQRRPWTTEEENALMAGLDRVRGPHWSQILAMFGPGGTVNESLKDRNQVQLKDKARNLKLFFLKGGIEVPYYLKYVTGDLKTRAPAQASKNEARERERQQGEEDKAHFDGVQGIMALAGAPPQFSEDPDSMGLPEDAPPFEMLTPPTQDQMTLPLLDSNVDPSLSDMQIPSAADERQAEQETEQRLKTE